MSEGFFAVGAVYDRATFAVSELTERTVGPEAY